MAAKNDEDSVVEALEKEAGRLVKLLNSREAKRPLIMEFSGTPKSGKTMAISVLRLFMRRRVASRPVGCHILRF
ncbi:MAG TPA: hypothetical protein VNH65_02075 [Candidatus Acidoferrum sp.]|nr:hypothetical protein [Candidatus Acidoferrum sp.]